MESGAGKNQRGRPPERTTGDERRGARVSDQVINGGLPAAVPRRVFAARRSWCVSLETGYDAAAWLTGLVAAARTTGDLQDPGAFVIRLTCVALLTCLSVTGCGLVAGLYRGRHQRGSLDEVAGV